MGHSDFFAGIYRCKSDRGPQYLFKSGLGCSSSGYRTITPWPFGQRGTQRSNGGSFLPDLSFPWTLGVDHRLDLWITSACAAP